MLILLQTHEQTGYVKVADLVSVFSILLSSAGRLGHLMAVHAPGPGISLRALFLACWFTIFCKRKLFMDAVGSGGGGLRASMASKLSKAKTATGKGMHALASGARQLGNSSSGTDSESGQSSNKVSYYAGLGPTGTAQDVRPSLTWLG